MATKLGEVKVSVPVTSFVDEGVYYIYTPALDLYGYGKSASEAKESFQINLKLFFEYTLEKGSLDKVLTGFGWQIQKNKGNPKLIIPDFLESLRQSDMYETLNSLDYKKFNQPISIPLVA